MTPGLQRFLLASMFGLGAVDVVWGVAGHFDIDAPAYGVIALITLGCLGLGLYYDRLRAEPRAGAMLFGTGFLIGISADLSLLNYLLLTIAGPRIDGMLAAIDRALGFNWPQMVVLVAHYPIFNMVLQLAYVSQLAQIALLIPLLGLLGQEDEIAPFCIAIAAGGLIAIVIWTLAPSFGAFSVYPQPVTHVPHALDAGYAHDLINLLANGPGHISPRDIKGLIGFPSFHATLALLVAWHGRRLPLLRWFLPILALLVLISAPIQGGHHLADVMGGILVTILAVWIAKAVVRHFAPAPQPAFAALAPAAP